jgi:hypothetical protein
LLFYFLNAHCFFSSNCLKNISLSQVPATKSSKHEDVTPPVVDKKPSHKKADESETMATSKGTLWSTKLYVFEVLT